MQDTWSRHLSSRVAQANSGTLFRNGASELSPALQDALVHFLASRECPRLGSTQAPSQVDVRLMATSHDTSFEDVTSGRFRDDLFYRLSIVHVTLPALRRRRADIPVLFDHFLRVLSAQRGLVAPRLTNDTEAARFRYDWPGNVVQIQDVADRLVATSAGCAVEPETLPREVLRASPRLRASVINHEDASRLIRSLHIDKSYAFSRSAFGPRPSSRRPART
jgi:DNA-binding NtrC family response regulator